MQLYRTNHNNFDLAAATNHCFPQSDYSICEIHLPLIVSIPRWQGFIFYIQSIEASPKFPVVWSFSTQLNYDVLCITGPLWTACAAMPCLNWGFLLVPTSTCLYIFLFLCLFLNPACRSSSWHFLPCLSNAKCQNLTRVWLLCIIKYFFHVAC